MQSDKDYFLKQNITGLCSKEIITWHLKIMDLVAWAFWFGGLRITSLLEDDVVLLAGLRGESTLSVFQPSVKRQE